MLHLAQLIMLDARLCPLLSYYTLYINYVEGRIDAQASKQVTSIDTSVSALVGRGQ